MGREVNRRQFIAATSSAGVGLALAGAAQGAEKPATLGGTPVRTKGYPSWPRVDAADEGAVLEVVRAGRWYRNRSVEQFEKTFAELNQAKYCVATSSGTSALATSLGALRIGPGDEVLVPPYTFMASITVVLLHYAMPVFVDSDRETFVMDPGKLEAAITDRTTGCYSFQVSKNLCSGEGGAILTNDETMANKCFAFHTCCRRRGGASPGFAYQGGRNTNVRMTEFQGALLLSQMEGLEERAKTPSPKN